MTESSPGPQRRLPVGYYLDNFETVLRTARERYAELLTAPEHELFAEFHALSIDARRLYVRLLSRKGPVFRRDRLDYPEIAGVGAACEELEDAGFADRADDLAAGALLPLFLRAELVALVGELGLEAPSQTRKPDLMALLAADVEEERFRRAVESRFEPLRLLRLEQVAVFRLLFFGNLSQDWTEFVLRDIGMVRYESYELRRELRRFPDRKAIDDTLELVLHRRVVHTLLATGELESAVEVASQVLAKLDTWHPTAFRSADRIFAEIGRELERQGDLRASLRFYSPAVEPPARERRTRVMARLGRIADAIALCEEIAAAPRDETEVVFARRFAHRLRRMRGEPLRPLPRRQRPQQRRRLQRQENVPVEQQALACLAGEGREGFFSENWLWKSLFGLAFWDIVFSPIAGAFEHPFQFGPLDLGLPSFRTSRAEAIRERLESLRCERDLHRRLMAVYDAKHGIANQLVAWQEELRPLLSLSLGKIDGRHLAWVCDRLSRDVRRYRRGLPDLFVMREAEPGFELIEVKAAGDQLRPEQRAWIDNLNEGGIPASILHIEWKAP